DGDTLAMAAGAYPGSGEPGGGLPQDSGFALLVEVDGSRAEVRRQRDELLELLGGGAIAVHEPPDQEGLWRWRDGVNAAVPSIAGEHGVGWMKRGRLGLQWGERQLEMHEHIKRAFDPKGLLNPGIKLARYAPSPSGSATPSP